MATHSKNKSNASDFHRNFQRSISPSGRFCSSSSAFSTLYTRSVPDARTARPMSPTRINLFRSISPSSSVRFSTSPRRSIAVSHRPAVPSNRKKTCMCSPTTHPGSFRCSLHKNSNTHHSTSLSSYSRSSHQLNMRRSAMTNSLVRIGTVEGDLLKRALATLIRPSSHHQRRRADFQPRPSRLSVMLKADDL